MRNHILKFVGLALLGGALLTGCSTEPRHPVVVSPTGEVYVPEAPPAPRSEVAGAPPQTGDVWVPGYWTYSNSQWVWMPGHWQVPPQSGHTWVAGHWDRTSRGWVWTPGHWE